MSNPNQAKLVITLPNQGTQEITLTKALTTLGRRKSNDVQLPVPTVSGQHAKIERTARGHTLTDLGSTNGTFVNGRRLPAQVPHLLAEGDEVHFGQVADIAARLTFSLEFERSLAVVIGINGYRHGIPPLQTAGNDARRLAEILQSQFDYEVLLLVDEGNGDSGSGVEHFSG